jgi:glycerol kinase
MRETTSLGAAIAAGFATGVWTEFEQLQAINTTDGTVFDPAISKPAADKMFKKWEKAVYMAKGWVGGDEFEAEGEERAK